MEYNRVTLVGRLTDDPTSKEVSIGGDNVTITSFSLAVNRTFGKDKSETAFINCEAWRKLGELIEKYCSKGREVLVEGYLKQDRWTTDDGSNRSRLKVVATDCSFGPRPRGEEEEDSGSSTKSSKSRRGRARATVPADEEDAPPF